MLLKFSQISLFKPIRSIVQTIVKLAPFAFCLKGKGGRK